MINFFFHSLRSKCREDITHKSNKADELFFYFFFLYFHLEWAKYSEYNNHLDDLPKSDYFSSIIFVLICVDQVNCD